MKKSEKILGAVTAIAVVGWLGLSALGGDDGTGGGGGGGLGPSIEEVEDAQTEFQETVDRIRLAPEVTRQFLELVGQDALDGANVETEERADFRFTREVAEWAAQAGFSRPNITKDVEDIEDPRTDEIDLDYQLVTVTIDIRDGDLQRIAKLLKTFESRGLIIQQVELSNPNMDTPRMEATIRVARLVEYFFATRAQRRARGEI